MPRGGCELLARGLYITRETRGICIGEADRDRFACVLSVGVWEMTRRRGASLTSEELVGLLSRDESLFTFEKSERDFSKGFGGERDLNGEGAESIG